MSCWKLQTLQCTAFQGFREKGMRGTKQKVNHSLWDECKRNAQWVSLVWNGVVGWVGRWWWGSPVLDDFTGEVAAVLALDCDVLVACEGGAEVWKVAVSWWSSGSVGGRLRTVCAACEYESHDECCRGMVRCCS